MGDNRVDFGCDEDLLDSDRAGFDGCDDFGAQMFA
jgi:hypothetical protein